MFLKNNKLSYNLAQEGQPVETVTPYTLAFFMRSNDQVYTTTLAPESASDRLFVWDLTSMELPAAQFIVEISLGETQLARFNARSTTSQELEYYQSGIKDMTYEG